MADDEDDVDPPPMGDGWAPRSQAARAGGEPAPTEPRPQGEASRRYGVVALAVAFSLGAALSVIGVIAIEILLEEAEALVAPATPPAPPAGAVAAPQAPRTLLDLKGKPTPFVPTGKVRLVNVWLEGCADCQPHFEAWQRFARSEQLPRDVPIANVAFTRATASFTERYRVDENLVIDADGSVLVRPLGISKFTTLVVGPDGRVCHQGHPADAGYDAALLGALARCARGSGSGSEPDSDSDNLPDYVRRPASPRPVAPQ